MSFLFIFDCFVLLFECIISSVIVFARGAPAVLPIIAISIVVAIFVRLYIVCRSVCRHAILETIHIGMVAVDIAIVIALDMKFTIIPSSTVIGQE